MADWTDVCLGDRSPGRDPRVDSYALDPGVLGLSARLVEGLRAWNDRYGPHGIAAPWVEAGWALDHDVPREFDARGPDVEVRHCDLRSPEPLVRGRRRPRWS